MEARRGELRVELVDFGGSYRARVTARGETVFYGPRIQLRLGGEARKAQTAKVLLSPEEWPSAAEEADPGRWEARWKRATAWKAWTASAEGMALARVGSTRWFGTLDLELLRLQGFAAQAGVVAVEPLRRVNEWALGMEIPFVAHANSYAGSKVRALLLLTKDEEAAHRKEQGGRVAEGWMVVPPALDDALLEIKRDVRAGAGMPERCQLLVELLVHEAGLAPPQPWHGDLMSRPSLAATVPLSEAAVPPYFPRITSEWGAGRDQAVSARAGTGKRKESEVEELAYYAARRLRWDRVRASGANDGQLVSVGSASGAMLGLTRGGNASAGPRVTQFEDPSRASYGARPTIARGDIVYFDSTGPHRGPGRAQGDPAGRRAILYVSFAVGAWTRSGGQPVFAFAPKGKKREFHLAFDKAGNYLLGDRAPDQVPKRARQDASEALLQMAGASGPS